MASSNWSDEENDLIVAEYFKMLAEEVGGRPFSKTAYRRRLKEALGRSEGSIEFKHQNISAVLQVLGEDWIRGYTPASNFQASLAGAVQRWLDENTSWTQRTPQWALNENGFQEAPTLMVRPPPTLSNEPPPADLAKRLEFAARCKVADRDHENRVLGRMGEKFVLNHERSQLRDRPDLSAKVRWVSEEDGDGAGYDIESYDSRGNRRLLEVKTTNGAWDRTPFYISRNELRVADENRSEWVLFRLWNFGRKPSAFELRPPLDAHVSLTATTFQASFH